MITENSLKHYHKMAFLVYTKHLCKLSGNVASNCGRILSLDGKIEELFNRPLTKSGSQQLAKFN